MGVGTFSKAEMEQRSLSLTCLKWAAASHSRSEAVPFFLTIHFLT